MNTTEPKSDSLKLPTFLTIRQVSSLRILPEATLRRLVKQGKVPGFYSGNRFMVNLDRLIEQLQM